MKKFASLIVSLFLSTASFADSGIYVGFSVGNSIIQDTIPTSTQQDDFQFDESSAGYKGSLGIRLDSLSLEASYHNFGDPDTTNAAGNLQMEVSGVDLSAIYNFTVGPIDLFAKGGLFLWESETNGLENFDKDGADPVFGIGAAFRLGSLGIRGEVEMFNVSDIDDLYFVSLGITHTF